MADTKQHAGHTGSAPVEGDGIHYAGIGWFVVILTVTTLFCMALVWGVFEMMSSNAASRDVARPAVAGPAVTPAIADGRIVGSTDRPGPDMLVVEPTNLAAFRAREEAELTSYGWVDENAQIVRIPIERAKELMLERGFPTR